MGLIFTISMLKRNCLERKRFQASAHETLKFCDLGMLDIFRCDSDLNSGMKENELIPEHRCNLWPGGMGMEKKLNEPFSLSQGCEY